MEKNEFKDRLFDVLNDTDNLPIQDIMVEDRNDKMNVYLTCRKLWKLVYL